MGPHPTREEIDRCVRRDAPITEILATAQHLDECAECHKIAVECEEAAGIIARPVSAEWIASDSQHDFSALLWVLAFVVFVVMAMAFLLTEK